MGKEAPVCRFNSAVECRDTEPKCRKCGWNPKVVKRRLNKKTKITKK